MLKRSGKSDECEVDKRIWQKRCEMWDNYARKSRIGQKGRQKHVRDGSVVWELERRDETRGRNDEGRPRYMRAEDASMLTVM